MTKFYAQIIFEKEGVVVENVYKTLDQALAFRDGFAEATNLLELDGDDNQLDGYRVKVDTEPAKDEE